MRAPWAGPARVLDGAATAAALKAELRTRVEALRERGLTPGLGTVLVGQDPGSLKYVAGKHADCAEVGIASIRTDLPATATQAQVEAAVDRLNADDACTGYIVQLPLPAGIDTNAVLERVDPAKDADGLHPTNLGRLVLRSSGPVTSPLPCASWGAGSPWAAPSACCWGARTSTPPWTCATPGPGTWPPTCAGPTSSSRPPAGPVL